MNTQATFTVGARDFLRTVSNAAVFAGSDDTLPVLNAVRLEISEPDQNAESTLTAVATDRYAIGIDTCATSGVTAPVALLVALPDVTRLVKAVKDLKRLADHAFVVAWVQDDGRVRFVIGYDTEVTVRQVDGEFPRYRALMPDKSRADCGPIDSYDKIGLSPCQLARFAKVDGGKRSEPMVLTLGQSAQKPILVSIGESFTGLQMPVRLSS